MREVGGRVKRGGNKANIVLTYEILKFSIKMM